MVKTYPGHTLPRLHLRRKGRHGSVDKNGEFCIMIQVKWQILLIIFLLSRREIEVYFKHGEGKVITKVKDVDIPMQLALVKR